MIGLYSYRYTVARGWVWVKERDCSDKEYAKDWLSLYQKDDPGVYFVLATTKPKQRPEGL